MGKQYDGAHIQFKLEQVPDVKRSEAEGRPIYNEIEVIEVHYPGSDITVVPVNEIHKREYAEQYNAFKAGLEQPESGTPLEQWAPMPRNLVLELKHFGIRTVEQLAEASAEAQRKHGMLKQWMKKAKEWLAAANSTQSDVAKLKSQMEALETRLKKAMEMNEVLIQRIEATEGTRLRDVAA